MDRWIVFLAAFVVVVSVSGTNGNLQIDQLDAGDVTTLRKNISRPEDVQAVADWKEQCRATAGQEALDNIDEARQELVPCITKIIKMDKLMHEINISSPRGELDVVFKKYCKKRAAMVMCIENFFSSIEVCLTDKQKEDLNVTRRAIDAGIDFICYKEGDHIALFMAEQGKECVEAHMDSIGKCIGERVPDIKNSTNNPNSIDMASLAISEESCKKLNAMHGCVVKYTELCDDPTPSNILDSLITQMLKVTPCWQTSSASPAGVLHFLPHLLTLMTAALMAANILL
ncbi:hypothetical protein Pmani_012756 [Petrolisthes manimaculis]|uniref:27 kDa hemolymph protein n=1 Tax=Petrolisthes manimaculis TaxID=1843537 RepID=A0AAE1PWM0_9EUCA|nr:hypothetical protein Pmani_012756 [Petrolisthes manimaculis]